MSSNGWLLEIDADKEGCGRCRLLTGSILAHELMHAWLRLDGKNAKQLLPRLSSFHTQIKIISRLLVNPLGRKCWNCQNFPTATPHHGHTSSSIAASMVACKMHASLNNQL